MVGPWVLLYCPSNQSFVIFISLMHTFKWERCCLLNISQFAVGTFQKRYTRTYSGLWFFYASGFISSKVNIWLCALLHDACSYAAASKKGNKCEYNMNCWNHRSVSWYFLFWVWKKSIMCFMLVFLSSHKLRWRRRSKNMEVYYTGKKSGDAI